MTPTLSVIIPAYNEERRLGPTLVRVRAFLEQYGLPWELLVVDDGSGDRTAAIAAANLPPRPHGYLLCYTPNRGKGHAVRQGVLASTGKYVAFTDADLSTPIEELARGLMFLQQGYAIAIGSRGVSTARVTQAQPLYRRLAARLFDLLRDTIVGLDGLHDTQCGLKVFDGDVARFIFARSRLDDFLFDVECLYIAQHLGLRIKEFGVTWAHSPDSKVRVVHGALRLFPDLVRIRLAHGALRPRDYEGNSPPPADRGASGRRW